VFSSYSREDVCHICEYSREKYMVDVIVFGSTVGSHRISNEVRQNKFAALASILLASWQELSFL